MSNCKIARIIEGEPNRLGWANGSDFESRVTQLVLLLILVKSREIVFEFHFHESYM